jgi:biopolymer transport protein ExbB/TolQ
MILLALTALLVSADPPPAAATKTQRLELAKLQKLRDSLVASRWEKRRQDLAERDTWNDVFIQVRDSLESARQERSQADLDWRRIARDQSALLPAIPASDPADPLDGVRRELSGRLEALGERVSRGVPFRREERIRAVDSVRRLVSEAGAVESTLPAVVDSWRREWKRAQVLDSSRGPLPRPEGDAASGTVVVWGALGGWYASEDGRIHGALVRSGAGGAWEWREDLSDSARQILSAGTALLPVDPGVGSSEGAGFFHVEQPTGLGATLARMLDFRQGPLHAAALWAARAVMALLVFLCALVAWTGWIAHRRLRREERDAVRYEEVVVPAMASESGAKALLATLPETVAGRLTRMGLASRDLAPEALEQVLTACESAEQRKLERGLARLGTIGSNAPFIGLFGTVCGILDAFAALGQAGGGPQAVMTAIAEALIATAVGLFVAIPAIWVYNTLQVRALELGARARELRILMVAASLDAASRFGNPGR